MMDVEHSGRQPAASAITSGTPAPRLRVGFVLTPRFTLTAFAGFIDALNNGGIDLTRSFDGALLFALQCFSCDQLRLGVPKL